MLANRRLRRGVSVAFALAMTLGVLLVPSPASAHETREVGPYTFTVGFANEPAFAGQPNAAEVSIVTTKGEKPVVEGVELDVEVSFGDETRTMEIEPNFLVGVFGEEGNYGADFLPTRPGQYSFRFSGTVEDLDVDETFTSGPETFNDVNDPAEFAFPEADPPVYEVAGRVETESARLDEAVATANTARTFGLIALVVGILALLLAAVLMVRRRS